MNRPSAIAALASLATLAAPAHAQVCGESSLEQSLQYLRRLSLDLRGRLPDLAELDSVVTNGGALDPSIVHGIATSEDLVGELREHHRDLLWVNVGDLRLVGGDWNLSRYRGTDVYWLSSQSRARAYRGGSVPCLDEPARFGPSGEILTTPEPGDPTIQREGWVRVAPYWDPTSRIRVCAFDAQVAEQARNERGRMVECGATANEKGCGCGPELRWCQSQPDDTAGTIKAALAEQLLRFVDGVVRSGRPYTEILTARDMEVNGPIAHYLRYQATMAPNLVFGDHRPGFEVPEIPFAEVDRWVPVTRDEAHAGLLTMPAYLLKFQSDRGRANRFYEAFMCVSFQAPPGGLAAGDDPCNLEPDLTKRCGCKSCHLTVEPAAAHWGRWAEAGFAPLPEARYPKVQEACTTPAGARSAECRRLYFTDPQHPDEEPFRGHLRSYVFADARREANIAAGPRALAEAAIGNGQLARCTTRRLFERYMGRAIDEQDAAALAELTALFEGSDHDLRALVEAIVKRPEYVEAGRFEGGVE